MVADVVPAALGPQELSLPLPGSALEQGSGFAHSSNRCNGNSRGHGVCLGTPSYVGVQSHGATSSQC